jgi:integrase
LWPVEAVQAWLDASGITEGPIFRPVHVGGKITDAALTAHAVAVLIKHYAKLAGLDAAEFSGHSLRSGFLTSAAEAGSSIFKMIEVSRHKSVDTLRGYVRRVDLFKEHAGAVFL